MSKQDVRWVQRLNNYCKALDSLKEDLEQASERELSDLEKRGVIKSFEYTQELAWNVIKDLFESAGETKILGSKDAFRLALNRGITSDGTLFETIESRVATVHTYNQETANDIFYKIREKYYDAFEQLRQELIKEKQKREL